MYKPLHLETVTLLPVVGNPFHTSPSHPAGRRGLTGTRKVGLTAPNSFVIIPRPRTPCFCSFSVTFHLHTGTHLWEERRWGFSEKRLSGPALQSLGRPDVCPSPARTYVPRLQVSEASGVSAFQVQESEAQGPKGQRREGKPQGGGGRRHAHPSF